MTTLTDEKLLAWLEEISQLEYVGERDANNAKQLAARFRELLAQQEWQPIEKLTRGIRGGPRFDAWVVPPEIREGPYCNKVAQPHRITDAGFSPSGHILDRNGQFIEGKWFYDEEGDRCVDPDDKSDRAFRVTHFRSIPAPPKDG